MVFQSMQGRLFEFRMLLTHELGQSEPYQSPANVVIGFDSNTDIVKWVRAKPNYYVSNEPIVI